MHILSSKVVSRNVARVPYRLKYVVGYLAECR